MRDHLIQCLEDKHMSCVPKTDIEKCCPDKYRRSIDLYPNCCGLPEVFDNMIECSRCGKWFHQQCKGVTDEVATWNHIPTV